LSHVHTGHTGNVNLIVSHATLPLVCSYERKSNMLIIWHKRDTDYFSPINILTNVQDYYDVDASDMCWMTYEPGLFISTKSGIELFLVKSSSPNDLDFNDDEEDFAPLISYFGMKKSDTILENSEDFTENMIIQVVPIHFPKKSPFYNNTILVAVSKEGDRIGIWRIFNSNKSKSGFDSKLLFTHEFDYTVKVTWADCKPFKQFLSKDSTNFENDPYGKSFLFVIGCEDGKVHTYSIQISDSEEKEEEEEQPKSNFKSMMSSKPKKKEKQIITMEEQSSFQAEEEEIKRISIPNGITRLCTYAKGGDRVNIWESESSASYSLEQSIPVKNVNCIRWVSLGNGQNILAIGTDQELLVYTQGNLTEKKNSKYWKKIGQLHR
jgi:hypothetical protein